MDQKEDDDDHNKERKEDDHSKHLFVFTNEKAGMATVDKDRINRIIWENSKNSKYVKHAQRQDQKVDIRVQEMKNKLKNNFSAHIKANLERKADRLAMNFETKRCSAKRRICVVVDMDMFYAAVEIRDRPELREKPVAVGGVGMISTANYVARQFGVRSAMPGFIGKKLCPDLVFVKPDFEKYTQVALQTREIFKDYDPDFRAFSLDEAYLDITEYLEKKSGKSSTAELGTEVEFTNLEQVAEATVQEIRSRIFNVTKLTASAGIAPNFMLAKISSDKNKPNGQFKAPFSRKDLLQFVRPLPVRKIPGIGKVTEKILKALEIHSCEDIFHNRAAIMHLFSEKSAQSLICTSLGISHDEIADEASKEQRKRESRKSISHERTFQKISNEKDLLQKCKELSQLLAEDMQRKNLRAKNISIKFKTVEFDVKTRAKQATRFLNDESKIFDIASNLLKAELPLSLRLLGVRASHFEDEEEDPLAQNQKKLSTFFQHCVPNSVKKDQAVKTDHNQCSDIPQRSKVLEKSTYLPEFFTESGPNALSQAVPMSNKKDAIKSVSNDGKDPWDESVPVEDTEPLRQRSFEHSEHMNQTLHLLSSDEDEPMGVFKIICPICGWNIPTKTSKDRRNDVLNKHIDDCLSQQEINRISRKEKCKSMVGVVQKNNFEKNKRSKKTNSLAHTNGKKRKSKPYGKSPAFEKIDRFIIKKNKSNV